MKKYIFWLVVFVIVGVVLGNISEFLVNTIAGKNAASENPISQDPIGVKVFLGIILSPIIETFIFQHLILQFCRKIFDDYPSNYIFPIFFSALAFSLGHIFSFYYMIDTFIMGSYFAFCYLFIYDRFTSKTKSFIVVWVIHLVLNTFAIL